MPQLVVTGLNKTFGEGESLVHALSDIYLSVNKGEFLAIMGASGSGKTTLLNCISTIDKPDSGSIVFEDFDMIQAKESQLADYRAKNISYIFQAYNLVETLTVYENVILPLQIQGKSIRKYQKKVNDILGKLAIQNLKNKFPNQLSGGQRQRVALGRAIVRDAKVFLMDEPLSNLDAKLRVAMRAEIAKLHRRLETTTIYVTHDQTEAMTMADRIVIMKDGIVQQIGSPQEVYNTPNNVFVAGFIGSPAMNFFKVTLQDGVISNGKGLSLQLPLAKQKLLEEKGYNGKELIFGIRPEDIKGSQIVLETYPSSSVKAEVVVSELLGAETMLYTKVDDTEFVSKVDARDFHNPGEMVDLAFDLNKSHFFDAETETVIR